MISICPVRPEFGKIVLLDRRPTGTTPVQVQTVKIDKNKYIQAEFRALNQVVCDWSAEYPRYNSTTLGVSGITQSPLLPNGLDSATISYLLQEKYLQEIEGKVVRCLSCFKFEKGEVEEAHFGVGLGMAEHFSFCFGQIRAKFVFFQNPAWPEILF